MKINEFKIGQIIGSAPILKNFLDRAPNDEVYSGSEVSQKTGLSRRIIWRISAEKRKDLGEYMLYIKNGVQMLWGNPVAIKAMKRKIAVQ